MSKRQHGNREAKKPKKVPAKPMVPDRPAPIATPVVAPPARKA
jgi:hypothetical protein